MSDSAPASPLARYRTRGSPHARAAIPAALIAFALLAAVLVVIFLVPSAAAEPAAVYLETDGERYIITMKRADVGEMKESGGAESIQWAPLDVPSEALDTADGTPRVAYGKTSLERITDVRLVFADVRVVINGTMHQLHLEQDTLHIRLDTPGAKGDALLLVLDGSASVAAAGNGVLAFTPRLIETAWGPGKGDAKEPPQRSAPPSGTLGTPPPGTPPGGGTVIPNPQPSPSDGNDQGPPPPPVGHLELFFAGRSHSIANTLNVTITKIALGNNDTGETVTWYENSRTIDLVAAAEDPAHLLTAQVRAGRYDAIHIETSAATVDLAATGERNATVPQPRLVLETGFNITTGKTLQILIEIGVEESLRVALSGLEYRPVVTSLDFGETERATGLTTLLEPYPAQYRTDGAWLPSLGETGDRTLRDAGHDPASIPHPIYGDQDRPLGSEGTLADPDIDVEQVIEDLSNEVPDPLP